MVAGAAQDNDVVQDVKTAPGTVMLAAGNVAVTVPKAPVVGAREMVPEVALFRINAPAVVPDTPEVTVPV